MRNVKCKFQSCIVGGKKVKKKKKRLHRKNRFLVTPIADDADDVLSSYRLPSPSCRRLLADNLPTGELSCSNGVRIGKKKTRKPEVPNDSVDKSSRMKGLELNRPEGHVRR